MVDRNERLISSAKRELADIIASKSIREFKAENFKGIISITEVKAERGHQHFRFYLSILGVENKEDILKIFESANSSIRGELCRRLKLRFAPTISFYLDESLKRSIEVISLLNKLKDERIEPPSPLKGEF